MQRLFRTGVVHRAEAPPQSDQGERAEPAEAEPAPRLDASMNPVLDAVPRTAAPLQDVIHRGQRLEMDDANAQRVLDICSRAEKMDYDFALRMQGLLGADVRSVWQCPTPEGSAEDRKQLMERFVRQYVDQFLHDQVPQRDPPAEDIAGEAVRQYTEFNRKWALTHSRCLSPLVAASAESLMACYAEELNRQVRMQPPLTPADWSMVLRRCEYTSIAFATALAAHMNAAELQRGHRNASYKAMSGAASANLRAQQDLGDFLQTNLKNLQGLIPAAISDGVPGFDLLCPLLVDWYDIARQLNAPAVPFTRFPRVADGRRSRW